MARPQDLQFWATCPHCEPGIDQGVIPVTVKVSMALSNFGAANVVVRADPDTGPIRSHMERLHPDKLRV